MNGSCGGSTIGSSSASRPSIVPVPLIRENTTRLKPYYDSGKLVYTIPKTVMKPGEAQAVAFDFITRENEHIELPAQSQITLEIIRLESS